MARVIRSLRKSLQFSSYSSSSSHKTLISQVRRQNLIAFRPENPCVYSNTLRHYISDMRRSAFEGNILRLLRNEIRYELERSPPNQAVTKFGAFTVDERLGEQWIRLERKYAENENIKIEVTMFDRSIPAPKSGGSSGTVEDVLLHITVIVNITKGDSSDVLEIMCSAWPDSLEIDRFFLRRGEKMPAQPYAGPEFKELDDDLQNSLYEYLEARGVDDELAVFLHKYMNNKDKTEFIRWMETVKSFIEIN
ncbi:uncharacterized protein At2g39795, mitochondrial [Momordica charantia]|uniref:Uncharacterized protein At2g39795, mitochondrial n=1 Tax=Momordica charantia TaxID=3673 RepID=A0A6J1CTD1_MOMCH|nr:uncharacterized protein At2g39795, mitochondrial [Momordica charantia]